VIVAAAAAVAVGAVGAAEAAEVRAFQINTQGAFLAGTLDGISVDPLGRLRLADRVERLTSIEEPFVFAAAAHPDGWVVGTGNAGKVLLVERSGETRHLFTAPEPEIFAVWADPDGTVFAGSSPSGKVYRVPAGADTPPSPEEALYFDPGETYIWALARDAEGRLLVATGTEGRLYRVDEDGPGVNAGEVVYDGDDTHLRTLLPRPGGEVIVGTAGDGLVQRLTERGGSLVPRTLYDAEAPEVVALAAGPDGRVWAAVAASEASLVDLSQAARPRGRPAGGVGGEREVERGEEDGGGGDGEGTVVVIDGATGTITSGSRKAGASGPRSRLIAIDPAGRVEEVWSFADETVFALSWQRGRLWIGTGLQGKLYSWDGSQLVLEKDVDEGQVVALAAGDPGPAFATTNAAAVYRVGGGLEGTGTYTSAPLDAGQAARFGTFRWRGELPPGSGLELSFRSGVSAEPDRTWSEWTGWRRAGGDGERQGGEQSLGGLDPGRYVQWRARFAAGGGESPRLYGVELSYRQENLRPRVARFRVLDPGEILVPASFNPSNQVYEPASPNRQGIFTSLAPSDEDGRLKTLWKKGHRSLRWSAEDDNGDELRYRLGFRPEAAAGDGAGRRGTADGWLPMADDLEDDHFGFDSTALPDGVYRFRLEATDAPDNVDGTAMVAERVSEPVVVDNSPPVRVAVKRRGGEGKTVLAVTVEDAWNPLRNAEYSVDAGEWRPAEPADGLLDGRREELAVEVPEGARLVLLRVEDAAFNTATFNLSGELR
jgi:hypothetical protein